MGTGYTLPITKEMVCAKTTTRVSTITSEIVCGEINRMIFRKAKAFMEDLVDEKQSIKGKYYTNVAVEVLSLVRLLESNAINRGITPDDMELFICAHMGPKMLRGRRKRNYGMKIKISHIHAILKPNEKLAKKHNKVKKKVEPKVEQVKPAEKKTEVVKPEPKTEQVKPEPVKETPKTEVVKPEPKTEQVKTIDTKEENTDNVKGDKN
jgi:ribosomal protein L22